MSTLKINTLSNVAGTQSTAVENAINGSAKAWVNFNGTGTVAIRASYNVSSITDVGTGIYTVNFTTAMPDTNYSCSMAVRYVGSIQNFTAIRDNNTYNAGSFQVTCYNGGYIDPDIYAVAVFR